MRVVYWMINFVIAALIVMGAINTAIRFAENTHKYGPIALKKVAPVGSFVVSNPLALTAVVMIGMMSIAITLSHLAGPPGPSFVVGPDGTIVLDSFLFPII